MWNFDIGLTGLDAARKGLDVIGNNIANAATEGYHRQTVNFVPADSRQDQGELIGGGVEFNGTTRLMDSFLELEILRQQSSLGQVSQESSTLSSIESAFGELTGNKTLSDSIDQFFNSLNDLSAHPDEVIYQNQVLVSAQTMTGQFRTLGNYLNNTETEINLQAQNVVDQINTLAGQIAGLNDNIQRIEMSGSKANNLLDQRDQLVNKLSGLAGIQTQQRDFGVVDVNVGGIPIVMGATTIKLQAGLNDDGLLGLAPAGSYTYQTTVEGGQLGGLINLYNSSIKDIHNNLDTLAVSIMQQVNQYHVQGIGSDGSFTELTGQAMTSGNLSDFNPPVSDGSLYIRLTNTATGEVTRHEIKIDASADSLMTIASKISGITGLNATAADNRLSIQADAGYKFDFLPAVMSAPTTSNFTDSLPPAVSVSGIYTGSENQTFSFTVDGNDSVGNGSLKLNVKDGAGQLVKTLNIGAGYAAGDTLDIGNGIKITVGSGKLNNGDSFTVDAFANTDTSGLLSAIGINTFFAGTNASDINLAANVADSPGRIATSLGAGMNDNTNAQRLASLGQTNIDGLDSTTASQFYRKLVTDIGQQVSIKKMTQSNAENLMQSLTNQQSNISGVDINNEAAQMLVFQQMFQATAKYLGTVQTMLSSLMDLV